MLFKKKKKKRLDKSDTRTSKLSSIIQLDKIGLLPRELSN